MQRIGHCAFHVLHWASLGHVNSLVSLLKVAQSWHSKASWVSELHKLTGDLSPGLKTPVQLGWREGYLAVNKHSKF